MARILVVEDDADIQQLLARRLRSYGHQVITAPSARFAVVSVGFDFFPDVALLDVGLPGMDGFELLSVLRRHPELNNPNLPAVFLSGSYSPDDIDRAEELGATYLLKPFVSGELNGAILNAVALAEQEASTTAN